MNLRISAVSVLTWFGIPAFSFADEEAGKLEFFESRIRPVLVETCYECHSTESGKTKGGLLLDSRAAWQVGGESGPAIVPGNPDESRVIQAISRSGLMPEMPPKSHLPEQVIEDFRTWIADGAVDPREGEAPVHEEVVMDIEAGRQFWSFQPRQTFTDSDSIDGFIRPTAETAPADKLVRRLFLDLIGLPPAADERTEFRQLYEEQSADEAVRVFADRLLARTEFGEKWARHWLDVARYADSNGGDFNLTFTESWRYRNYVIDAFNADMPYDQFLREQIAGDLMPHDSPEQRNRQLIATGFLMIAPKMLTERNKPKMHLDIADEQVDTIGRAVMGLTLGCARCHDHKFDPIPTADYYAMAGILHSTRTADGILMNNVNVNGWTETELIPDDETLAAIEAHQAQVEALEAEIAEATALVEEHSVGIVVDDSDAERSDNWRASTFRPNHVGAHYLASNNGEGEYSITWTAALPEPGEYELRVSFGGGSGLANNAPYTIQHRDGEENLVVNQTVKPSIRNLWHPIGRFHFDDEAVVSLTNEGTQNPVVADAIQLVLISNLDAESNAPELPDLAALEAQLNELKDNTPEKATAMAAADHTNDRFGDLEIRIRGEAANRGDVVSRGFLQVATAAGAEPVAIPDDESGRAQLADWLTNPDHPLTARVMANRIWQQLFGRGIVATADNFGMRGTEPSNPELLDFLAGRLVANDWSMKSLVREIVTSKTWQQASQTGTDADPDNNRFRHQNIRPAPAETIRDSILAIAGELDPEPRESVVDQLGMYAIQTSGRRHESLGQTESLRQRSIYMPVVRGAVPPSLAVFDFPNPDLVTGTRATTTVPAQALFMMNSPFVLDMATALSEKLVTDEKSTEDIVRQLYVEILARDADLSEVTTAETWITQQMNEEERTRTEAVASFVQILFSSTEFRFIE